MTACFVRIVLIAAACLGATACAPFNRGTVDNRPEDRLKVRSVRSNGNIELSNGRIVRLFGVQVPESKGQGDKFVSALTERLKDQEVTVDDVLIGEPTAVSMTVWQRGFICGNGLRTWDASAKPFDLYNIIHVAQNLLIQFEGALNEDDLIHGGADPNLVESMRRSRTYGKEYRAGRSK